MELAQNIKITFKGVFKRFKAFLSLFGIYTLRALSSLNNRLRFNSFLLS